MGGWRTTHPGESPHRTTIRVSPRHPSASAAAVFLLVIGIVPATASARTVVGASALAQIDSPHPYPAGDSSNPVVWSRTLSHPGATFLKLHIARLGLGRDDTLAMLDGRGRVIAEVTTSQAGHDFWLPAVPGDQTTVVLRASGFGGGYGLTIDRYGYGVASIAIQSTCGTDLKEDVACYAGTSVETASRAVGRLLFEERGVFFACTGFLISPRDHVLTNEHCISSQAAVDSLEVAFDLQAATCGGSGPDFTPVFLGDRLLLSSVPLDFALISLRGQPSGQHGFLRLSGRDLMADEPSYLPQHSGGDTKKVSVRGCQVVTPALDGRGSGTDFGHVCDTEPGSSGSPVLDLQDHVVGLHRLGGCTPSGGQNQAVRMSRILEVLPVDTTLLLTRAHIQYAPDDRDRILVRGVLRLAMAGDGIDPLSESITLTLADAEGIFYSATIPPRAARSVGRAFQFSDPDGRLANGLRSLRLKATGFNQFAVFASARGLALTAARETITITLTVGTEAASSPALFRRLPHGLVYP
ncbi:MAG: hypothetical protein C5B48_15280 [Candidatus Rokuibacteriota bacterium]|nr:MAG: hypothetical protein C5B48_15280 [Candidatus Rokubacteria bacterium]